MLKISSNAKKFRSPIRDMIKVAKELEAKGKKIFYFNIGDPNKFDFDTPKYLKDELAKVAKEKSGYYSTSVGDEELIDSIVKRENEKNKTSLTKDDVVITNGISEGLIFLFGTILEGKGGEILLPGPAYPPYLQWIGFFGGTAVGYKTDEGNGWQPDVDDIRKKITDKTELLVVINPNNPTGAVYEKKTLKEIVDVAGEFNVPLVSDEIYDQLIFGDIEHVGLSSLTKDVPLIGLNGFSKAYLIPGWRLGYIYFHNPNGELNELKTAVKAEATQRLSACTPIMKACAKAYKSKDHIKELNKKLKERAEFAFKRFNEMERISAVKPKGAFYIFPKVDLKGRWKTDEEFCLDVLKNTGIVFPYGSGFDPVYGKDHFRSVILPPIEMMEKAFEKMENFMKKS